MSYGRQEKGLSQAPKSNEAAYRKSIAKVREEISDQPPFKDWAHAIIISLEPLGFLRNISEAIASFERRLNSIQTIDERYIYRVGPSSFVILAYQSGNSFTAFIADLRMTLVRLVQEFAPQAFQTIQQNDMVQVYNIARHGRQIDEVLQTYSDGLAHVEDRETPDAVRALGTEDVTRVMSHINSMPDDRFIEDYLSWQPIVRVRQDDSPRPVLHEYYISMQHLRDSFLQGTDIFTNMSVFQMLTTELDKRVLSCILKGQLAASRGSFNLNINSILSVPFEKLGDAGLVKDMFVEVRVNDVFSDVEKFWLAQRQIKGFGGYLALDGVVPRMMDMLRCENFGCDVVKIQLEQPPEGVANFEANVRRLAETGCRIVGTRVESLETVRYGMRLGIGRFQGFYLNRLLKSDAERDRFFVD